MPPGLAVVRTAARPDLVPVVAGWLWQAFWRLDGYTLAHVTAVVGASGAGPGPQQTFVLLRDARPIGTASLAVEDLDERPGLTPWLAGVFVVPEERGHGYVRHLLDAVEAACRAAGIGTLWLYTHTAEGVYARAGWSVAEVVERVGKPAVTVMRREFGCEAMETR